MIAISDREFEKFVALIFQEIGITLGEGKKALVESRFLKRIMHYNLNSYEEYYQICVENTQEKIEMLNLITTNETYFFREMEHFHFLKEYLFQYEGRKKIRIWSAASSIGAEAYSIAMICDTLLPSNMFEVLGSDINSTVIKKARMGLYPITWAEKIQPELRHKYCLRGKGKYEGQFLIDRKLAKNIRFQVNNLLEVNREFGRFEIVFLRNVLLYFNHKTRQKVIENVLLNMRSGSILIISQTENLHGLDLPQLEQIEASIYRLK